MQRYTFVVQVHPEGISTIENLSTNERVQVSEMEEVGPQIERWLDALPLSPVPLNNGRAPSESAQGSAP